MVSDRRWTQPFMISKSSVKKKYMPTGKAVRVSPDDFSSTGTQKFETLDAYPNVQRLLQEEEQKYIRSEFIPLQKVEPQLNTPLFSHQQTNQKQHDEPIVLGLRPQTADADLDRARAIARSSNSARRPETARASPLSVKIGDTVGHITVRKGKYEAKIAREGMKNVYLGRYRTERIARTACVEFIAQLKH